MNEDRGAGSGMTEAERTEADSEKPAYERVAEKIRKENETGNT